MSNPNSPSLFPETGPSTPRPLDSEAIAATARPVEFEDRTSEAAKDQGWGPAGNPEQPDGKSLAAEGHAALAAANKPEPAGPPHLETPVRRSRIFHTQPKE